MKIRLELFNPNKKTVGIFAVFSIVMAIAMLQGENFTENDHSIFYSVLFPVIEPTWNLWLYVSAPVLYFVGISPVYNTMVLS